MDFLGFDQVSMDPTGFHRILTVSFDFNGSNGFQCFSMIFVGKLGIYI